MRMSKSPLITDPDQLRLIATPSSAEISYYLKAKIMEVTYARQPFPNVPGSCSIALCGPTPRDSATKSWRPEALGYLHDLGYTGHVFVPEDPGFTFRDWEKDFPYDAQVQWEHFMLEEASCLLFWVPRNMQTMPGFTTNDEFGAYKSSGRVVFGAPLDAEKVRYQLWHCKRLGIPTSTTLKDTCKAAFERVTSKP